MKKFITLICLVSLIITPLCFAETDYVASKWIEMIKDGEQGSFHGKDGNLRDPQVTGTLKVDTIAERTSAGGVTIDGLLIKDGAVVAGAIPTTTYGVGTAAANVVAVEYGDGITHQTVLTANDLSVVVDGTAGGGFGGSLVYTFPEGMISIESVVVDNVIISVDTNSLDAADGGDWAFGTVIEADFNLTDATDVDLCPKTSADPINGTNDAVLASSALFDGTTTAKTMNFNLIVDDADIGAVLATNTASFGATVTWKNTGNN